MNHFHQLLNLISTQQQARIPHRHTAGHLLPVLCGVVLFAASALANPTDEIIGAVAAGGVSDVSQALPRQFTKALNAVAMRVPPRELPDYVIAAIHLRPELAPNIVAVAIKAAVTNLEGKPQVLRGMVERIVTAGVAANPESAVWIARAGASAAPEWHKCIVEAASAAAPNERGAIVEAEDAKTIPLAFLTFSATGVSGFSFTAATLNPANISDPAGDSNVNSPEKPPSH